MMLILLECKLPDEFARAFGSPPPPSPSALVYQLDLYLLFGLANLIFLPPSPSLSLSLSFLRGFATFRDLHGRLTQTQIWTRVPRAAAPHRVGDGWIWIRSCPKRINELYSRNRLHYKHQEH